MFLLLRGFLLASSPSLLTLNLKSAFSRGFSFRKLQIFISQTTDFHFVSFHFVSFRFVSFRFAPFRFANGRLPVKIVKTLNDRQSTRLAESLRSFLDKSRKRKEESGKRKGEGGKGKGERGKRKKEKGKRKKEKGKRKAERGKRKLRKAPSVIKHGFVF